MPYLDAHPRVAALLGSLGVLLLSYVAAWLVAHHLARALARRKAAPDVQHRLVDALDAPFTYALFLVGAWVAVHRAPLGPKAVDRLDTALFVIAVAIVALALVRVYRIFLGWYAARPQMAGGADLAREFNPLFGMVGTLFVATLAVIAVLQRFGVNVASLVVSLGVGSLAVGLAAQDTLSNMFAGFTLMLDRPFRAGDRIQLASGEIGDVEAIGMRATLIRTLDETVLVVPNSLLVKERLVNLNRPGRSITTRVEVGVAYGSDAERVKAVLREAALASPHVDRERPPVVQLARFSDFAVHFVVVFWSSDYLQQGAAKSDVSEAAYRGLAAAGIEMPLVPRPAGQPAKAV
jgi:small-conductance mechanosensitive channel